MQSLFKFKIIPAILTIILLFGVSSAFAKSQIEHFHGTVTAIEYDKHNFTVSDKHDKKMIFTVTKDTEFELIKHFSFDEEIPFSSLKVGDWVNVKSHRVNNQHDAVRVKIHHK